MSNFPTIPQPPDDFNPYSARYDVPQGPQDLVSRVRVKVLVPAIFLLIVSVLGLGFSIFSLVIAFGDPLPVDPNQPEFFKDFQKGQTGPLAAAIQSVFVVLNLLIIAAAVQMIRFRQRIFATVMSGLSMVNFGSCCCILGFPVGLWSLIILLQDDVAKAFEQNAG